MMFNTETVLLLLLLLLISTTITAAEEAAAKKTKSWTLYHAVNGGTFHKRGTVKLSVPVEGGDKKIELEIENDPNAFGDGALPSDDTLTVSDLNRGLYKLKLVEDQGGNNNSNKAATIAPSVLTTVPGCHVRRSNFRDEMVLTFGEGADILSFTYMPLVSPLAPKTCTDLDDATPEKPKIVSKISYETSTPGMTLKTVLPGGQKAPPGLKFLPKSKNKNAQQQQQRQPAGANDDPFTANGDGDEENKPPPVDNTPLGFLKRYWYILLPLLLSNLISAPPSEQQQQQQEQQPLHGGAAATAAGQGQQQPARVTASSSGAGGGSGTPRARRGKRG